MLMLIFLGAALIMGIVAFRMGLSADWHPAGCILAGLVPIGFTFFLGIFGLLIGVAFLGAVYKATE